MRSIDRQVNMPLFVPDYIATSVRDIDFELLAKKGIKYVAFDADSTLVPYRGIELAPSTKNFLKQKEKLFRKWCIASNRITNDLHGLSADLNAEIIKAGFIRKPQKRYFKRVLKHFDAKPSEVVMIGDKLVADIWGAKYSGLTAVWVEHLGKDSLWDRIIQLRHIERLMLGRYLK